MTRIVVQLLAAAFGTHTAQPAQLVIPPSPFQLAIPLHSVVQAAPTRWFTCRRYCQVVLLRQTALQIHRETVELAQGHLLTVPQRPHLTWKRPRLRREIRRLHKQLRHYRKQAVLPWSSRLPRWNLWMCIHHYEGSWQDAGDPYWGGLQMDRQFMWTYGADMIRKHAGGLANTWAPWEQVVVAERAYANRGFSPWPNTARYCGLL